MDFNDIPQGAQGKYNQAFFLQLRLHELWLRVDRNNTNLLSFNELSGLYNYEVVFNDLSSILRMVLPYLKQGDTNTIKKAQEDLREIISDPILSFKFVGGKKFKIFNKTAWINLQKKLYEFELNIELLAHKHGLGNPVKDDPSKAVIN